MQADRESMLTRIAEQLETADEIRVLRAIHDQMPDVARGWKRRGISSSEILFLINEWHDMLIRRVVELVLADMEQTGWGAPPSPFCWLLLGSGGRREQTLQPDQDNAILYVGEPAGNKEWGRVYFKTLAEKAVTRLAEIGYPYCPGFVMATNSRWNLSLEEWRRTIESYASYPNWDNARFLTMTADMRCVYGDVESAAGFQNWFLEYARQLSFIHWQVADHGLSHQVAINFLDRFRIERWGGHTGELNIKEGGYLQIVNATRIWAMAKGVSVTSTEERIAVLQGLKVWDDRLADRVRKALHTFLHYRLWSNYICPDKLSEPETLDLIEAMKTAKQLQKLTFKQFRKPK